MPKYTFVVLTNPVSGKEDEYNKWYNGQHIPDLLNIPGLVCAQRFRVADTQIGGATSKHKYMALHEIFKELAAGRGTADMVLSDAIDMNTVNAFVFEPVAEKVQAKDVRRPRRAA